MQDAVINEVVEVVVVSNATTFTRVTALVIVLVTAGGVIVTVLEIVLHGVMTGGGVDV